MDNNIKLKKLNTIIENAYLLYDKCIISESLNEAAESTDDKSANTSTDKSDIKGTSEDPDGTKFKGIDSKKAFGIASKALGELIKVSLEILRQLILNVKINLGGKNIPLILENDVEGIKKVTSAFDIELENIALLLIGKKQKCTDVELQNAQNVCEKAMSEKVNYKKGRNIQGAAFFKVIMRYEKTLSTVSKAIDKNNYHPDNKEILKKYFDLFKSIVSDLSLLYNKSNKFKSNAASGDADKRLMTDEEFNDQVNK